MGLLKLYSWLTFLIFCISYTVLAQNTVPFRADTQPRDYSARHVFHAGGFSLQQVNGALASPVGIGPDTDRFHYTMHNLRVGYLLNAPSWNSHPLDGAVELIGELSGSAVFQGAGSYLFGTSIHLRYNFTQPEWRFIPYLQLGGGLIFNDAYEDQSQRAIGQELEFTPQASAGLRYLIDPQWSLDAEFMYHHISNAGLADRNLGINALGGMVGFSYFFDYP
ncbi:MAG: acyloxyacyl hydrolase [Verrucomicrobiota bacterium]